MGRAKDRQERENERHFRFAPKCVYCTAPVETAGEIVCSRCQRNLAKVD